MSAPGFLVAVAAVIGALVAWRGSRIVGGALVVGALVMAVGLAGVSLPSRDSDSPATTTKSGPWELRVTLEASAPARVPARLRSRWVDLPGVGSARPDAQGRIIVRGEPRSGLVEMQAVKAALRASPHVAKVERL